MSKQIRIHLSSENYYALPHDMSYSRLINDLLDDWRMNIEQGEQNHAKTITN